MIDDKAKVSFNEQSFFTTINIHPVQEQIDVQTAVEMRIATFVWNKPSPSVSKKSVKTMNVKEKSSIDNIYDQ